MELGKHFGKGPARIKQSGPLQSSDFGYLNQEVLGSTQQSGRTLLTDVSDPKSYLNEARGLQSDLSRAFLKGRICL